MRLWVRSGVPINQSFGYSGAVGSASDTSNDKVLYQPINPIARQSDFREKSCSKEKTALPKAPTCNAEFFHVTARYAPPGWRISTPFPFKIRGKATLLSFRIDLPMSNCCSHEDSARSSTHQQWITNGAASSVNHHSTTAKDKTKRRSTAPPTTRAQVNILEAKKCPETPSPADFAALKDWSETGSSTLPAYVVTPPGKVILGHNHQGEVSKRQPRETTQRSRRQNKQATA